MTRHDWWLGIGAVCTTLALVGARPVRGQILRDRGTIECSTWVKIRATDRTIDNASTEGATAWVQGYM